MVREVVVLAFELDEGWSGVEEVEVGWRGGAEASVRVLGAVEPRALRSARVDWKLVRSYLLEEGRYECLVQRLVAASIDGARSVECRQQVVALLGEIVRLNPGFCERVRRDLPVREFFLINILT